MKKIAFFAFVLFAFSGCGGDTDGLPDFDEICGDRVCSSVVAISYGSLYDSRDGQTYKTVAIGSQTWMAENLNYNASGSVCYSNSSSYCNAYGRLYNWSTSLSACPSGWHLPSDSEWDVLTDFVGSNAGRKLKATSGWYSRGNGTDEFGFSALPGGDGISGSFLNVGDFGYWWSATEVNASYAYYRNMYYYSEDVFRDNDSKSNLFSVRCLQD